MKIYTRVVIDIQSGNTITEESFEYHGEIAECKGGGGGGSQIDRAYNARMATVAEKYLQMSQEYERFWITGYFGAPTSSTSYAAMQRKQIGANIEMIPIELQTAKQKHAAQQAQLAAIERTVPYHEKAAREGITQALNYDPEQQSVMAGTTVIQQGAAGEGAMKREVGRMGGDVGSGQFLDMLGRYKFNIRKAAAGQRTKARFAGEQERFRRLMQVGGGY